MDRQLPHCRMESLSCHECVGHSATNLATIAGDLNGAAVKQLFFAMYPAEPCLSMASAFVQVYQKQRKLLVDDETCLPLAHAAVA